MVLVKAMLCIEDMAPKLSDFFEKPAEILQIDFSTIGHIQAFFLDISKKTQGQKNSSRKKTQANFRKTQANHSKTQ